MRKTLLEDHPAGWSTINGKDFSQAPGYSGSGASTNPNCYCHGGRSEGPQEITDRDAADCGCEYVYILNDDNLVVLSSYSGPNKMIGMFGSGDPNATWRPILEVRWDDPEPDWESVGEEEE
mgnify:CR=1 FL=1